LAPGVRAEGVDVFVLGEVDCLHESLRQVGDGMGGFGFHITADNGGDEASQGSAEIAGGEVVAGEEVGEVFAEFLRGAGSGFFLGVVGTEAGIVAEARSLATAAIGERKRTQGHAVLLTERGHRSLLRVEFWDCGRKKKEPARSRRYKTETPRSEPGRSNQQRYCTTAVTRVKLKSSSQKKKSKPAALKPKSVAPG